MNHAQLIDLDYQSDLHQIYQSFSDLPGFVLLESADKTMGRYDILSACPYHRIQITQETQDKLAVLKELDDLCRCHLDTECDLPFQGGAIGFISYDLGAQLQGIESIPQPSLASMPLLDFAFYDWGLIIDHTLAKVTLYAANEHHDTKHIIPEILNRWKQPTSLVTSGHIEGSFRALMSLDEYQQAFAAIHTALRQGRSYQVNLTQPFLAHYEGDAWALYRHVIQHNPVPFAAFMRLDDADILSFSPERFLLYDRGTLLTSPIKGTIKRADNPEIDAQLKQELLDSTKNRAENTMIVDLLRNDLAKIAKPGSVKVSNLCAIQSFKAVHHLVSDIQAEPQETITPVQMFLSCFPGGSITGAPKREVMHIIHEQELFARGVYCGSIAYFSRHARFDSNIAIRTITAKDRLLHLAAGGGIVIDSQCDDEYKECTIKIEAIIQGLKSSTL